MMTPHFTVRRATPHVHRIQIETVEKNSAVVRVPHTHVYVGVLKGPNSLVPGLRGWTNIPIATYVDAIRQVGAQNFVLSSDLVQAENPIYLMGYKVFVMGLMQAGISADEIDVMARKNPARLLGLDGPA